MKQTNIRQTKTQMARFLVAFFPGHYLTTWFLFGFSLEPRLPTFLLINEDWARKACFPVRSSISLDLIIFIHNHQRFWRGYSASE